MKIIFVRRTPLGRPGAASTEYFPAELARLGHSVTMIGLAGGDCSFLISAGVQVVEVSPKKSWFATLRNIARVEQPDIIHVFIHLGCGFYPFLMRVGSSPRFVLDIRSPLLRTGSLRYLVRFKNRFEVRAYDAIASHGVESAWTVVGQKYQIHWLPPGVDLDAIPIIKNARPIQPPVKLVYIGSLHKRRKIPEMVRAVLIAAQALPLHLDLYGDGEDSQAIEAMLQQNNIESKVRLMGVMPRGDLFCHLADYDLGLSYVPTGVYDPAPPLKTLEYLASGLAVVATRTSGHALFIQDGENGLMVGESPQDFSKGILRVARDPVLRQKLTRNARSSVAAFDSKQIVQLRLLPLYYQLLEG